MLEKVEIRPDMPGLALAEMARDMLHPIIKVQPPIVLCLGGGVELEVVAEPAHASGRKLVLEMDLDLVSDPLLPLPEGAEHVGTSRVPGEFAGHRGREVLRGYLGLFVDRE